jgi:Tfp pilus assembly protein PilN
VRAVNLIPADQRRGAGGIAGRSGGVAYVLTGGLAVLVLMGVVYAFAVHNVATKKTDLAEITQQVDSVTAQAQSLAPYVQFAGVSTAEVGQVASLAESRFNWPGAMRQLALALPSNVTLSTFSASAGLGTPNADGTTDTSFSLAGCAGSQAEVAKVLTNLASVPGVSSVSLSNASKAAASGSGGTSGACAVIFTLSVDYAASYTIPNTSGKTQQAPGQTVSSSTPTVSTAARQQTTGVAP